MAEAVALLALGQPEDLAVFLGDHDAAVVEVRAGWRRRVGTGPVLVEVRRDELLELRAVGRSGFADVHSAASRSRSAATDGRSAARSTHSASGRMVVQVDAQTRLGAEDPGQVRDVREPELPAGQEGPSREAIVEQGELVAEPVARVVLSAAQGVVRTAERVEPLDEETPLGALGRVGRPERRLRIALLEVLVDDHRLGQDELVLFEHRHLAQRVLLVDPRGPVAQVDHDRLVVDALLGEDDPDPCAVRAAVGVVERDHGLDAKRRGQGRRGGSARTGSGTGRSARRSPGLRSS